DQILNSAMRRLRSIAILQFPMETPMTDLEQFRNETRAWLEANCPPEMRKPATSDADVYWGGRNAKFSSEPQRVWFERMRDKGWTVPDWPREYGGGGLSAAEHKVLRSEMARMGARPPLSSFGIWMLGPALLKFGRCSFFCASLPTFGSSE